MTRFPLMLVGLSGYSGSGKNAAADALTSSGWELRSFAAPLKDFVYAVNPIIIAPDGTVLRLQLLVDAYGWDHVKNAYPEARELLQRTGTEAGRVVLGENVWVDRALRGCERAPVVLGDCRFRNEADAIRARGGLVFRIERPGVGPKNDHISETALDGYDFDAVVQNKGSLERLHELVVEAVILHASARR